MIDTLGWRSQREGAGQARLVNIFLRVFARVVCSMEWGTRQAPEQSSRYVTIHCDNPQSLIGPTCHTHKHKQSPTEIYIYIKKMELVRSFISQSSCRKRNTHTHTHTGETNWYKERKVLSQKRGSIESYLFRWFTVPSTQTRTCNITVGKNSLVWQANRGSSS